MVNEIKDVEACGLTYFKPADTVEGLISDLHSSLPIETVSTNSPALDAYFVDQRYKRQRGRKGKNRTNYSANLQCIIGKKKGCWSTNNSRVERLAAMRQNCQIRQFFTAMQEETGNEKQVTDDNEDEEVTKEDIDEVEEHCGSTHVVQSTLT